MKQDKAQSTQNSLTISLTEPVVFLRTYDNQRVRNSTQPSGGSPAVVRGLLTLNIVKPTRVSSIELELQGKATTSWPEGVGARRIEITETRKVFYANTVFFKASGATSNRRAASIGPGLLHDLDHDLHDREEVSRTRPPSPTYPTPAANSSDSPEHHPSLTHESSPPPFSSAAAHTPRSLSVDFNALLRSRSGESTQAQEVTDIPGLLHTSELSPSSPLEAQSPSNSTGTAPNSAALSGHRVSYSALSATASTPNSAPPGSGPSGSPAWVNLPTPNEPTPPYTPRSPPHSSQSPLTVQSPTASVEDSRSRSPSQVGHGLSNGERPAQTLEELRRTLRNGLSNGSSPAASRRTSYFGSFGQSHSAVQSSASSIRSTHDVSLSRRPSFEDVPEDDVAPEHSTRASSTVRGTTSPVHSGPASPHDEHRGRRGSRFSLAAVSNVFDAMKDRVRSRSPRTVERMREREGHGNGHVGSVERGRSRHTPGNERDERENEPGKEKEKEKHKSMFGAMFAHDEAKDGEGWKEFKKGTYTYPISFTLPANAPPTIECDYGSMVWRLKGEVHRPGAFKSKLTTSREVLVIAAPGEDETEETENIIVERQWEDQLQYLIVVSGRSFPIGGTIPVTLTLMPLAKAKVHRISIFLEERIDYYTQMKRVARSQNDHRISLLSLKNATAKDKDKDKDKDSQPILPLQGDSPDEFAQSTFARTLHLDPEAASELAASFMGPGPWTLQTDLKLPGSCALLHFTNRNRKSNIMIHHTLKIVLRVERGDGEVDPKTKRKRLFDIVVQTPLHILSCRCSPEWMSLPRYSEILERDILRAAHLACPCDIARAARRRQTPGVHFDENHGDGPAEFGPSAIDYAGRGPYSHERARELARIVSGRSTDSSSEEEAASGGGSDLRAQIVSETAQYERLVAGLVSEAGEEPPAYWSVVEVAGR